MTRQGRRGLARVGTANDLRVASRSIGKQESGATGPRSFFSVRYTTWGSGKVWDVTGADADR